MHSTYWRMWNPCLAQIHAAMEFTEKDEEGKETLLMQPVQQLIKAHTLNSHPPMARQFSATEDTNTHGPELEEKEE